MHLIDHTHHWQPQKIIPASKPSEVQSTVKMYKTLNQVHAPTLQPIYWACINSAIASTQSSVCAYGSDTYAYVHRQGSLTGIRKSQ